MPAQSQIVTALYVIYFGPLIFVLAEYPAFLTAAPAIVVGVTAAHFAAGVFETRGDLNKGARERYFVSSEKWLNIPADSLISAAFVISVVALAAHSAEEKKLFTLVSAILAVGGNIFCVAGRYANHL